MVIESSLLCIGRWGGSLGKKGKRSVRDFKTSNDRLLLAFIGGRAQDPPWCIALSRPRSFGTSLAGSITQTDNMHDIGSLWCLLLKSPEKYFFLVVLHNDYIILGWYFSVCLDYLYSSMFQNLCLSLSWEVVYECLLRGLDLHYWLGQAKFGGESSLFVLTVVIVRFLLVFPDCF